MFLSDIRGALNTQRHKMRHNLFFKFFPTIIALSCCFLIACTTVPEIEIRYDPASLRFSGEQALATNAEFVELFPYRHSGTPNNRLAPRDGAFVSRIETATMGVHSLFGCAQVCPPVDVDEPRKKSSEKEGATRCSTGRNGRSPAWPCFSA